MRVDGLGVYIGQRELLRDIDISCGEREFHILMGPVGAGKSTLLSLLDGRADDPVRMTAGAISYCGAAIGLGNHPAVIHQASREEQKRRSRSTSTVLAMIDAALLDDPALLCLDEPTASLGHEEVLPILSRLKDEAKRRAILMVTHNTEHARLVADRVTVIGGGKVIESGAASDVFNAPRNAITKQFLRTGSMALPRPDAPARTLAPELRGLTDIGRDLAAAVPERELVWVIRNALAVIQTDTDRDPAGADLAGRLRERGFHAAIITKDHAAAIRDILESAGIEVIEAPMLADAGTEPVEPWLAFARQLDARMVSGLRLACIADGDDRSSVILVAAMQLITRGLTAIDTVALVNAKLSDHGLTLDQEQLLWNCELALDLASAPPLTNP